VRSGCGGGGGCTGIFLASISLALRARGAHSPATFHSTTTPFNAHCLSFSLLSDEDDDDEGYKRVSVITFSFLLLSTTRLRYVFYLYHVSIRILPKYTWHFLFIFKFHFFISTYYSFKIVITKL